MEYESWHRTYQVHGLEQLCSMFMLSFSILSLSIYVSDYIYIIFIIYVFFILYFSPFKLPTYGVVGLNE